MTPLQRSRFSLLGALPVCGAALGAFLLLGCEAGPPTEGADQALSAETLSAEVTAAASDVPEPVIRVHGPRVDGQPRELLSRPLVVVDGTVLSAEEAADEERMMAFEIKTVEVMQGPEAIARYGERAANGVVVLTTHD